MHCTKLWKWNSWSVGMSFYNQTPSDVGGSTFRALIGQRGGWAGTAWAELSRRDDGSALMVAHLWHRVIRLPALQFVSHQPVHLLSVQLGILPHSFVLRAQVNVSECTLKLFAPIQLTKKGQSGHSHKMLFCFEKSEMRAVEWEKKKQV